VGKINMGLAFVSETMPLTLSLMVNPAVNLFDQFTFRFASKVIAGLASFGYAPAQMKGQPFAIGVGDRHLFTLRSQ